MAIKQIAHKENIRKVFDVISFSLYILISKVKKNYMWLTVIWRLEFETRGQQQTGEITNSFT